MLADYIRFVIHGIKQRRLRSWLTTVGIFIGIIAVVSLISIGQGLQNVIDEQFKKIGANRIIVTPGGGGLGETSNPAVSGFVAAKLSQSDLDVIRGVRGVENAMGVIMDTGQVGFKDKKKYGHILSFPTDPDLRNFLREIDYFNVEKGRCLRQGDKYAATVGPRAGERLFGENLSVGDKG